VIGNKIIDRDIKLIGKLKLSSFSFEIAQIKIEIDTVIINNPAFEVRKSSCVSGKKNSGNKNTIILVNKVGTDNQKSNLFSVFFFIF
jgi:hypothetical protein